MAGRVLLRDCNNKYVIMHVSKLTRWRELNKREPVTAMPMEVHQPTNAKRVVTGEARGGYQNSTINTTLC